MEMLVLVWVRHKSYGGVEPAIPTATIFCEKLDLQCQYRFKPTKENCPKYYRLSKKDNIIMDSAIAGSMNGCS